MMLINNAEACSKSKKWKFHFNLIFDLIANISIDFHNILDRMTKEYTGWFR